jgi:hypothetical protein
MGNQKFKYGDSIDDTVKLLQKNLKKKEDELEKVGKGKTVKMIQGVEIVTQRQPKIPLELPSEYFSELGLNQLEKTMEKWNVVKEQNDEKLQNLIERLDKFSSTVGVEANLKRTGDLAMQINSLNIRIQQIDFLIRELDKAILNLKPKLDVFVLGTSLLKSAKSLNISEFPSGYFSELDLEGLKATKTEWLLELETKSKKLQDKRKKHTKMEEQSKYKKLEKEVESMEFLLRQLEKAIEGKESGKRIQKDKSLTKDPILEEIKMKMGIPPKKKEPLPKMTKKKMELEQPPSTQIIFGRKQIIDLEKMFEESSKIRGIEIEASFGVYKNEGGSDFFVPGVYSGIYFSNLLDRMTAVISAQTKGKMDVEYSNTLVEIKKADFQKGSHRGLNVRKIIDLKDNAEVWQYKTKQDVIDNHMWGVRISKSIETFLAPGEKTGGRTPSTLGDAGVDPESWKPSISRYRKRTSFTAAHKDEFFYGVRIDLTVIRKIDHDKNFNPRGIPGFEVEVEKIGDISVSRFTSIIEQIYRWLFGDYSHSVFIREVVKDSEGRDVMTRVGSRAPSIKWDAKNNLFSDGIFAYLIEKQIKNVYGKIVPRRLRGLTKEEKDVLKAQGKAFWKISQQSKVDQIVGLSKRKNLPSGKSWDENLHIITDDIYAYHNDKIYAIIVGPEELSEVDKEQLRQRGKNIKESNQVEVNKITKRIRKKRSLAEESEESVDVEIYKRPTGLVPVYKEEEIMWNPDHIMTLEERRTAVNLHNGLFWHDMQKKRVCLNGEMQESDKARQLRPYQLWSDYWNRPKNIKLKDFLDSRSKWAITLKYDGVRSFLFIHKYGTYMVNPPYTLIYMGPGDEDMSGTLLDGEFMSDLDKTTNSYTRITFWVFDILFVKERDCRDKRLNERLSILNNSVQTLQEKPRKFPYLKRKKYIMKDSSIFQELLTERQLEKDTDIYENIRELLKENKNLLLKIKTLLREIKVPEEIIEVLLKKVEASRDISIDEIKNLLKEIQIPKDAIKIFIKKIGTFLRESEEIVEKTDGIILQPYIWYCNKYTFKWKPPSQLTIDFYLQPMTHENIKDRQIEYYPEMHYYYTMVGGSIDKNKKIDMSIFTGDYNHPYAGYIMLERDTIKEEGGEPIDGRIVECEWRKYEDGESDFVPLRIREDRTRPNDYDPTAISVWQDINNPITQDTIEGRNLKIMRKYHNEVKSELLAKNFAPGATILDIGSGRGGDIHKWRALGFKKVYAMEPDTGANIEAFKSRLEQDKENKKRKDITKGIPFTYPDVEILNYGSQKTRKIHKQLKKDRSVLDGIVAFFSLTFFPKNEKMYKSLLNTIDLIPVGGKFVGIVLSGERVKSLFNSTKINDYIKDYTEGQFLLKGYSSENDDLVSYGGSWDDTVEAWVFDDVERDDVQKYVQTHKTYNCDAFMIKQEGPFFEQKDEEEEDEDGISNSILGDEIMIDLRGTGDDQSTMVQSQTEWLFNFEYFKKKMRERMFTLVESSILDYPVTISKDNRFSYENLPKDSQVFSSLNKVFVFKKKGMTKTEIRAAEVLSYLKPGEIDPIRLKLNNIEYENIQRVGIIQSNTSFIHAVLLATNRKYQKMDDDQKEAQVSKVRGILADGLTLEEFQELHGGSIASKIEDKIRSDIDRGLGGEREISKKERKLKRKSEEGKELRNNLKEKLKRKIEKEEEARKRASAKLGEKQVDAQKRKDRAYLKELQREEEEIIRQGKESKEEYRRKLEELSKEDAAEGNRFREEIRDLQKSEEVSRDIKQEAFEAFQNTLKDLSGESSGSGSWMGELEMTELLSRRYKINIYVVSVVGTFSDMVLVKPSTLFSKYCSSLYEHNKSVVLLRLSGTDYDLLKPLGGDEKTNTFDKTNEFVEQLYQEICG